jgi:hypothetical protein
VVSGWAKVKASHSLGKIIFFPFDKIAAQAVINLKKIKKAPHHRGAGLL